MQNEIKTLLAQATEQTLGNKTKAANYTVTTSTGQVYTIKALSTDQAWDIAISKGLTPIRAFSN